MVGDEDADILVAKLSYDALNILHSDRVDTSERLVKHDELRVNGQTASDLSTTTLTTREAVTCVRTYLFQSELSDELLKTCLLLLLRSIRQLQHREDIVLHAELTIDRSFLSQITDTCLCSAVDGILRDILVIEIDTPFVRNDQPDRHIEGRRLPCTIRA